MRRQWLLLLRASSPGESSVSLAIVKIVTASLMQQFARLSLDHKPASPGPNMR